MSLPGLLAGQQAARAAEAAALPVRAIATILHFMWGEPAQQDTWDTPKELAEKIQLDFRESVSKKSYRRTNN